MTHGQKQPNEAEKILEIAKENYNKDQKIVKIVVWGFIVGTIILLLWRVDFGVNRNKFEGNRSYLEETCSDCNQW